MAIAGATAGGLAAAVAATSAPAATLTGHPVTGCVNLSAEHYVPWRGVWKVYTGRNSAPDCPNGSFPFAAASEEQLSQVSSQVEQNASAIASNTQALGKLQGVGTVTSKVLQDPTATPQSIATGGSFVVGATEIGTMQLPAGTYLVNFNAMATPNTNTGTAQVFPQFFVYNQVKNGSFAGDLFNVGTGALEPNGTGHDSYYGGSDVIIVPAGGETLHVYAFGYDSNTGAGGYALDSAAIAAVQLAS